MNKLSYILTLLCLCALVFLASCSSLAVRHTVPSGYNLAAPSEKNLPPPRRYTKEIIEAIEYFTIGYLYEMREKRDIAYESYLLALQYDSLSKEIPLALARTAPNDSLRVAWYKMVIALDSTDVRALSEIGDYYFLKREHSTALEYYESLIRNLSSREHLYVSTLYKMGFIHEEREQYSKAIEYYNRIINVNPDFPMIRRKIIMLLSLQQRFDILDSLFDVWIKEGDNLFEIYKDRGLVSEVRGEYDKALSDYRQALTRTVGSDDSLGVLTAIAGVYAATDNLDAASLVYLEILELDSSKIETLNNLGFYYLNTDNYSMAQKFLDRSLSIDSTQLFANFYKGVLMSKQDKNDSAIIYFKKAYEQEEGYLPARVFLGFSYMKLEKYSKADSIFAVVIEENPTFIDAYYYYAVSLRQQNKLEDAKNILRQALEIDDSDIYVLFDLGNIYASLGLTDSAISYFERVLEVEPAHALALNNLGYMLIDLEIDVERGGKLVSKALKIEPDNGAIIDSYGWYHYRKGNYSKALEYVGRAYEILGNDSEILKHLADIHYKLGNSDKALKYYNKALEHIDSRPDIKERIIERLEKRF